MNTISAKIASQFGQALADDMRARGEIGWTAERLADTSPVSPAIRARHTLTGAWTEGQSFFMTWARNNPRSASLADFSNLPADCRVWQGFQRHNESDCIEMARAALAKAGL